MDDIKFEWDQNKSRTNKKKHGITFEEASSVFLDESGIVFEDPEHSENEERFLILGFSESARMLLVCYCLRSRDTIIRIISARRATKAEEQQYTEINQGWGML